MPEETNTNEPLEALASKIEACVTSSDEKTLEAAKLIGEARQRVEGGEAGEISWAAWSSEHIGLSASRIKELCQIAGADDPAAKLREIREGTRNRVAKYRGKKQQLRNGPGSEAAEGIESAPITMEPERLRLTTWVSTAPMDHVERVLKFALTLNSKPSEQNPPLIEPETQQAA